MLKSLQVDGGLKDLSVSPNPLRTDCVLKIIWTWFGVGLGGFGTKGFGTEPDNFQQNAN